MSAASDILVLDAHPRAGSFGDAIATAYTEGAGATRLDLRALAFDPILHEGYHSIQALEPDLVRAQAAMRAAAHLVFVYPSWWGTYPALLKGFVDRTFLPGFAFRFHEGQRTWDRLLAGRTGRLVVTMDWPAWAYRWVQGAPGHKAMVRATLGFSGVKPVHVTELGAVSTSTEEARRAFLDRVRADGASDRARVGRRAA
ncbi:MAG: NAD(P)H-dependent oxidoreductase [Myxococcota bacterium]